MHMILCS